MPTDTSENQQYLAQTSVTERALATSRPVALFGSFAALFIIGGIVCGILTYWWTALPCAAFGVLWLLALRWNLRHREQAQNAVRLRTNATYAQYRAHPVLLIGGTAACVFIGLALRLRAQHPGLGWWILLAAALAALLAVAVGLWQLRKARQSGNARG